MAQQINVQRKSRQLDNDVQSIYEMLAAISGTQTRHGDRLDELAAQLDRMDLQLTAHGEQLAGHDSRLQGIDAKLDTIIGMLGHGDRHPDG